MLYADGALAIAFVVAIVGTVLMLIFIMPEKRRDRLKGVWRFFHELFTFRWMIIEKMLKGLYLFTTILLTAFGFLLLFTYDAIIGVFLLVLSPIVVRIVYELLLLFVLLVKNVMDINGKLQQKQEVGTEKE